MFNRNQAVEEHLSTTLSVRDCATVFERVGGSLGGGLSGMMNRYGAKRRNHSESEGFYTPSDTSPFSAFAENPAFSVGLRKLSGSAMYGAGYGMQSVEMFVYDKGGDRIIKLVAYGGGRGASEKLLAPFLEGFR
jgi:hypothetical protein